MSELTDWLSAQLDADEAVARAASPGPWSYGDVGSVAGGMIYDKTRRIADLVFEQPDEHDGTIVRHLLSDEADANGWHIMTFDPARVLVEVEAKRAIVARHGGRHICEDNMAGERWDDDANDLVDWPCEDLRIIASVFADRPGFDETWRP